MVGDRRGGGEGAMLCGGRGVAADEPVLLELVLDVLVIEDLTISVSCNLVLNA